MHFSLAASANPAGRSAGHTQLPAEARAACYQISAAAEQIHSGILRASPADLEARLRGGLPPGDAAARAAGAGQSVGSAQ